MEEIKVKPRGIDEAQIVSLIETQSLKGSGTEKDPARIIYQYWDFKGNLIFERE